MGRERRSLGAAPPPSSTRAEALAWLRRVFVEAGLDTPALDARVLFVEALCIDALALATRPDAPVEPEAAARLADFAARRLAREPVSRILNRREFWGLPFCLGPDTLVPRPDTEVVVEAALSLVADRAAALRILDLGTGSGCLLAALLHELPNAYGLGVDRSTGALTTARHNAVRNGLGTRAGFAASDWSAAIGGRFDLVVSNPPYIRSGDLAGLSPEVVEHDPALALDGGPDGLAAYRVILGEADRLLADSGAAVVEIGAGQEEAVRAIGRSEGFAVLSLASDLSGRMRAIAFERDIL